MESPKIYPYFYPITKLSSERNLRASEHGHNIPDEIRLANEALPRFEGHDQPLIHCLGDTAIRSWDDCNVDDMRLQTALAAEHGIDGFIFDSFMGAKNSKPTQEMMEVLDNSFLVDGVSNRLKFGIMSIFAGPRAVLPLPRVDYRERNRVYDISRQSVRIIVDKCAREYWERDNYIRINDRPYHSLFVPLYRTKSKQDDLYIYETVEYMKDYANKEYSIDPYIVAVSQGADQAKPLVDRGADAVTSYALLPDFGNDAELLQDYETILNRRINDWSGMQEKIKDVPYVPPVVVGWDASARCSNNIDFKKGMGTYPFTPIIQGGNSSLFGKMIREQYSFIKNHVPANEQYIPINAWNEITEGSALLPRVNKMGFMAIDLLAEVSSFKKEIESLKK